MKRLSVILTFLFFAASMQAQDLVVNTFNEELHTGGAHIAQTFSFPNDVSMYDSVSMIVKLTCPTGGCDPWDRFANIIINHGGWQKIEIGRYMTPYGNGWCDWTIDVSDYRNYLKGNIELISFIDTWEKGWEVTLDFEFFLGTPDYPYVTVKDIWTDYEFTYGDTIFYSIDIPSMTYLVPTDAQKVVFRINNTGHGQGNTDNAAEFSQKTHTVVANGLTFPQYLWKSDCSQNPCSPQAGTWQYARAGWCPGQAVVPWDYDVTNAAAPGQNITLDYILEPYFNQCSPFNPNCTQAVCPECTYNSNTHTRPHYKIAAQMLVYSNTPVTITQIEDVIRETDVDIWPNPATNSLFIDFKQTDYSNAIIELVDINGRSVKSIDCLTNTGVEVIDLSGIDNGFFFVRISAEGSTVTKKIVISK